MKLYTFDNKFIEETPLYPLKFTGIIEWQDVTKQWFVDGKWHRLDGPAVVWMDGVKSWWVYGKQITKEQCNLLYSIMKLKGLLNDIV